MKTKSKVIRMHGPRDVRLDTLPLEPLGDDEVQCKAIRSLISVGTEAIQYARNHDKSMHRYWLDCGNTPVKTSYNSSAEIIAVGKNVKDYKIGDQVYALCGHEQYFNIKTSLISKKPDWLSHEENAWLTILRTGWFACQEANLMPYDTIVIAGLGVFGFASLMFAKIFNARRIIAVDPNPYRAELAKSHGATHVFNAEIGDVLEDIIAVNDGKLVDVCIDATAWAGNIKHLNYLTRRTGNISVICDPPNTDSQIINWGYMFYRTQHMHGVYINQMLDERDPMRDQREFLNPMYPLNMKKINDFIYEKFQTKEIVVNDLIAGLENPENCKNLYEKLFTDRSRMLGMEFDWTLVSDPE